jgi:hypothetical protein
MIQAIFEGVRCFHDSYSCPIKPITILTGENSSGKTTFLALTRIAWDIAEGGFGEDIFNEEPFLLGSYDQIASYRGGRAGRANSFIIGLKVPITGSNKRSELFGNEIKTVARFIPQGAQSKLDEWSFTCGKFALSVHQSINKNRIDMTIKTPSGSQSVKERFPFRGWLGMNSIIRDLRYIIFRHLRLENDKETQQKIIITENELRELQSISLSISETLGLRPYAFAPIRTRPQRTYDPLKDIPKPEGSHVPMVLARTFAEKTESSERLRDALKSFGKASGLFSNVEIKRKGYKESDPFQIGIKIIGPTFNLVDVGYGVSQALPIVVDVVQNPKRSNFLLQQPEVHLHPKAQAELGSFLAALAKEQNKRFIIETHSDYLIDRIRIDVRDNKFLTKDDVSILYFERSQGGVKIHSLEIDSFGNIVNAPRTYRQFFLEEERRMFGV